MGARGYGSARLSDKLFMSGPRYEGIQGGNGRAASSSSSLEQSIFLSQLPPRRPPLRLTTPRARKGTPKLQLNVMGMTDGRGPRRTSVAGGRQVVLLYVPSFPTIDAVGKFLPSNTHSRSQDLPRPIPYPHKGQWRRTPNLRL